MGLDPETYLFPNDASFIISEMSSITNESSSDLESKVSFI